MSCGHGSLKARARATAIARDEAASATMSSELKKFSGSKALVCNKGNKQQSARAMTSPKAASATSKSGRSGACLSSDLRQPASSSARSVKSASVAQSARTRKTVTIVDGNDECSPPSAAQDYLCKSWSRGTKNSCSLSLPIATRIEAEGSSETKKDTPRSVKDTPRSVKDTPRSLLGTPRTMTDAALLKSQVLLQQLEQLGLFEDVEPDEVGDQAEELDSLSPVSEISTNASLSDWQTGKEVMMPTQCVEMMQQMMQELEFLRSKQSAAAAEEAKKINLVSVPADLLQMLLETCQEIKEQRLKDKADQATHHTLASSALKRMGSLSSQTSTEDGATELSVGDSFEASPAASSMPQSPPGTSPVPPASARRSIQYMPSWRPSKALESRGNASPVASSMPPEESRRTIQHMPSLPNLPVSAHAQQSDIGCKSSPLQKLHKSCQSQPMLPSPQTQVSRRSTMPPALSPQRACVSPAKESYLALVSRTSPPLPSSARRSLRPASRSPSPALASEVIPGDLEDVCEEFCQVSWSLGRVEDRLRSREAALERSRRFERPAPARVHEQMVLGSPRAQSPVAMQPATLMHLQTPRMQPTTVRLNSPRVLSPPVLSPLVPSLALHSPRARLLQRTVSITDTFLTPA